MRQEEYKTILETRLLPQLRDRAIKKGYGDIKDFIFMQDGAPCHKGRSVTNFLESQGIRTLKKSGHESNREFMEYFKKEYEEKDPN